jgi:hypothetical protein
MASQIYTSNQTLVSNPDNIKSSSLKVPSKEPRLVFNLKEYREMKRLEAAGDGVAVEDLKKKVRQQMELELTSGFNLQEFREMKLLEAAGDVVAIEDLKKKVRQRMGLELTSGKYNIFN